MSDSEDPVNVSGDEEADDLFGDEDQGAGSDADRAVSDNDDLASDRDEEAYGGEHYGGADEGESEVKTRVVMGLQMFRHHVPRASDGKLQSMRVPKFLKFNPEEYKAGQFEPSEWDIENSKLSNPKPTIRCRKNPETNELESNAVIYRWSDGSLSIAIGDEHYEIQSKSLAPPSNMPYSEVKDSHYYAAAAHLSSNALLTVGHITEQYTVRPNKNVEDDAVARLQANLAAAARGSRTTDTEMIITATQDPELQKKQAELAEKERLRAQRRRENAAARLESGGSRAYGRGGLSIGDLEGAPKRTGAGGRKRGQPGAQRPKRHRPEYDSDDDLPQGSRRQEDYDLEDAFIAPSDEEIESGAEEEEEEDILEDDDEDEAPRSKRQRTADEDDEDADADADADLDDVDAPAPSHHDASRRVRRHIIDDDEEE